MVNYTMVIEVDTKISGVFNRCKAEPTLVGYRRFNAGNSKQAIRATDTYVASMEDEHKRKCGCDSWQFIGRTFETEFAPI